ncbi:MAG TPA: hypothetical protein VLA56_02930 [Pseudomonadales bacterium]|nr:hypothetical protein [Pseudomonadales bacterium]
MDTKPSYLGLLNAIAVGEARGERLLAAWADATADEALAATLRVVAVREREHAAAFAKRICELGFAVREDDDPEFEARLACARGAPSDTQRFETLLDFGGERDTVAGLDALLADRSIDPQTGALLGRFIAEERDSDRLLHAHYERLGAAAPPPVTSRVASAGNEAKDEARPDRLEAQIDQLRGFIDPRRRST